MADKEDPKGGRLGPPPGLKFIVNSGQVPDKDEKSAVLFQVRSHVARRNRAKYYRRVSESSEYSALVPRPLLSSSPSSEDASQCSCLVQGKTCVHKIQEQHSVTSHSVSRPRSVNAPIGKQQRNPMTVLGSGRTDPFKSYPRRVPDADRFIDFWAATRCPILDAMADPSFAGTHPHRTIHLPFLIQDPEGFEILLFTGYKSVAELTADNSLAAKAILQKSRCIKIVNEAISRSVAVSDGVLLMVMNLAQDAIECGDFMASRSHAEGIRKLVDIRGGLHTLGLSGLLKDMVIGYDIMYAMITGSKPYLTKDYTIGLQGFSVPPPPNLDMLPSGFRSVVDSGYLTNEMNRLLSKVCMAVTTHTIPQSALEVKMEAKTIYEMFYFLAGQPSPATAGEDPRAPYIGDIQSCLYIALMICIRAGGSSIETKYSQDAMSENMMAQNLRQALGCTSLDIWRQEHGPSLLWITYLGAMLNTIQETHMWLMTVLGRTCRELGLQSWKNAKEILATFIWIDALYDVPGMTLWSSLENEM